MSRKSQVKFAIFVAVSLMVIPITFIGVTLLTEFVTFFRIGADPASIFRGHTLTIPEPEEAQWLSFSPLLTSTPTRLESEEILSAYWLAWDSITRAQLTDDTSDIPTYFAGTAFDHIMASLESESFPLIDHHHHELQLGFFSIDKSVLSLQDNFTWETEINDKPMQLQAQATVTMTLDNGFWRIRTLSIDYE